MFIDDDDDVDDDDDDGIVLENIEPLPSAFKYVGILKGHKRWN